MEFGPSLANDRDLQCPPLPPRHPTLSSSNPAYPYANSYGNFQPMVSQFNSSASPWNRGIFGNSNYYPNFGGPTGYNAYSPYMQNEPNFQVHFESASRPAFEVIESVVHTVGSVSQLLDSTYGSLVASFRSVLAVFDQFGRMKNQFSNLFSAFALIRVLKWAREKIKRIIYSPVGSLSTSQDQNLIAESVWSSGQRVGSGEPTLKWPLLAYLGILIGGPYLTWKMFIEPSITDSFKRDTENSSWAQGKSNHFIAQGQYDFVPRGSDELRFRAGDTLIVAPKEKQPNCRGWLLATLDGHRTGLVPANRIKITGKSEGRAQNKEEKFGFRPDILESSSDTVFEKFFE